MAGGSLSPWWCATNTHPKNATHCLAQALNQFAERSNVVPITTLHQEIADVAWHDDLESERGEGRSSI